MPVRDSTAVFAAIDRIVREPGRGRRRLAVLHQDAKSADTALIHFVREDLGAQIPVVSRS
ncbi:MAG TPA: hypothetical protein VK629_18255 [Steroidobacteraceae bacterium]|nr:hypothetical protein [Steroidobacteraceae bacterium]